MSGHDFEKQVRQNLNDLKLTPSASSWEHIEENLRERKRRLAPIFWLPLLLIGLTAGGYLFFTHKTGVPVVAEKKANTSGGLVEDTPKDGDVAVSKDASGKKEKILDTQEEKEVAPHQKANASGGLVEDTPKDGDVAVSKDASGKKEKILDTQEEKEVAPHEKANASDGLVEDASRKKERVLDAQQKKEVDVLQGNKLNASQKKVLAPQNKKEGASVGILKNVPKENIGVNKDASRIKELNVPQEDVSAPQGKNVALPDKKENASGGVLKDIPKGKIAVDKKKKTNKWSYGFSAFAGISSVNEGNLFNFNKAQVEDVSTVAAFAPRPFEPSSISPGFTYSAGAFVKRELSKKFSLSVGVNYLQLNTRNKVGSEINGRQIVNNGVRGYLSVPSFYTLQRDQQTDYRNKYHFIEIPVDLHTRINKSEKMPLVLNTGVAVSQLLKSNSLHFDGSTGVYYKNDKLLNQTQLAVRTGLSFGILNKTKRPIWIGPSARYNISKILQKDLQKDMSARKNFISLGIDAKLFIK